MAEELTAAVYTLARGSRVLEHCLNDITLPQVRVLRLLATSPERASTIAEKAAVSRPSLTGVIDGLEKRGWLRRTAVAGDRRGVSLEVTAQGLAALQQAEKPMVERLAEVLGTLEEPERRAALEGLSSLASALERWAAARTATVPADR
jgi:DNA-binding MarR family transcriptional regulator